MVDPSERTELYAMNIAKNRSPTNAEEDPDTSETGVYLLKAPAALRVSAEQVADLRSSLHPHGTRSADDSTDLKARTLGNYGNA